MCLLLSSLSLSLSLSLSFSESTLDNPLFADKEYEDEQERMQKETIEKYREWRQNVLEAREADQLKRDSLKKAQLRKAIKIQVRI